MQNQHFTQIRIFRFAAAHQEHRQQLRDMENSRDEARKETQILQERLEK